MWHEVFNILSVVKNISQVLRWSRLWTLPRYSDLPPHLAPFSQPSSSTGEFCLWSITTRTLSNYSSVQSVKPKERSRNRTRKLFWCPKLTQNGLNSGCCCCVSDIFHRSSKISGLRERGGNMQSEICGKEECELAVPCYCSELLQESGSKERQEEDREHCCVCKKR